MTLSHRELVINDILKRLKKVNSESVSEVYQTIISKGKHRNYLTRGKYYSIISKLQSKGIIKRNDNVISLTDEVSHLTHRDILTRFITSWPNDIIDGLG